jgi:hypothetical protein
MNKIMSITIRQYETNTSITVEPLAGPIIEITLSDSHRAMVADAINDGANRLIDVLQTVFKK